MFTRGEDELIREWGDRLGRDVALTVVLTGDARSDRLLAFADALAARVPAVQITPCPGDAAAPAIVVGSRLRFLAAPGGTELEPFLDGVASFGSPRSAGAPAWPEGGRGHQEIRVYVSAGCPHCPVATRRLLAVLEEEASWRLTVIDAELFPELAAGDQVKSVPTVIAGTRYRSTGTVPMAEVKAALQGRTPDPGMLARLLDGGDAEAVADMMMDAGEVFPAVLDRIAYDTMTVRLGAMAALERLCEKAPDVARSAEGGLWDRIAGAGREATGDLLYMLGETGTQATAPWLEAFYEATTDEELREAVTDALARIAERA